MTARAWQALKPQLNDGFSLTNFIWELKDIPRLLVSVKTIKRMLVGLDRSAWNSKSAAELLLSGSFGVLPLVSDLKTLASQVYNFEKTVNKFIDAGKKTRDYHYTEVVDSGTRATARVNLGLWKHTHRSIFHATLRCSYTYRKPSAFQQFARVAGLRPTAEDVWNAIPFSFVVDWMLKIADMLRQLEAEDPHLTVHIKDYCHSIKCEEIFEEVRSREDGKYFVVSPGYSYKVPDGQRVWRVTNSVYVRTPGMPNMGFALPASDSLSARELVLAGALARANM
jgi:hypothetical protein